ncbi:MAG: hypothetical protein BWY91_02788 [bacterium ADurb.BinA028]|nr:MAG: hypothetical protein BWY91_02788 [bacterium ADurb.BinA028]
MVYSRSVGKNPPLIRSRWTRSIITASGRSAGDAAYRVWSRSQLVAKPSRAAQSPIPLGISVGGATTVTRAPSRPRVMTLERNTREWAKSPTMTMCRPSSDPSR